MKTVFASFSLFLIFLMLSGCHSKTGIDRFDLVTRHNIEITKPDSLNPLSVGNGEFAFTVDITGLQTFPDFYSKGIPLGTMSEWGWHTEVNSRNYNISQVYKQWDIHGRAVNYVHSYTSGKNTLAIRATDWLRRNPHKFHLGMIGLQLLNDDGSEKSIGDLVEPIQKLDLWKGEISSSFNLEGESVKVLTVCHPEKDMILSRISSKLAGEKKLRVKIHFPFGIPAPLGYDFNNPEKHFTKIISEDNNGVVLERRQDNDVWYITVSKGNANLVKVNDHLYYLEARPGESVIEFSCRFSKQMPEGINTGFKETEKASADAWKKFWLSGGAVDFSGSTDPRAYELERRVILSQYLTRIQSSGVLPPAETGLTYNSWFGKFHLEMHWWHSAHFAMWQRSDILEKQMDYYSKICDNAAKTARIQGYDGVRWPKMTDPDGNESPSGVGPYLIWQQPHVIYYAEQLYQAADNKLAVLNKYWKLVSSTADFMASYAWYDTTRKCYSLGPALISAQETLRPETTINPTFELVYWYWGLRTAEEWRKRLGYKIEPGWDMVANNLAPLPQKDGVYLTSEDNLDSWTNQRMISDHPIISGIMGMIPETDIVDKKILGASLDTIQKKWNWKTCWGWDYPLLAMSATAIDRPEQAVDFLMMEAPKNRYLVNGHNYQDARLSIYLPGNGGILSAVAMMCTSDRFPKNGKWKVKWEGLSTLK
jgi:hypothetical protein